MKRILGIIALIMLTAIPAFAEDKDGDVVFQDRDSSVTAEDRGDGEIRYVVRHQNGNTSSHKVKKDAIKEARGNDSE